MKKELRRWKFLVVAVIVFLAVGVGAGAVCAEPLLVMQPAYVGMNFYVHQPHGIPGNWYTTYDGYPVWKGTDGVWFYGSYSNQSIIQTSYVVGSVVPSMVDIYPYVIKTNVVAAHSAPAVIQTSIPAAYPAPVMAAVAPVLKIDPSFMVLGTWRGSVDRVGILVKPSIPVAWKGMWPKVLYAWTGSQWDQMTAREGERPGDVLKKNLYALTRLVHQNGSRHWEAPEAAFLANQSAIWGYVWMGQIGPNPHWIY